MRPVVTVIFLGSADPHTDRSTERADPAVTGGAIEQIETWLDTDESASPRLVTITNNALVIDPIKESHDLRKAALWGLLCATQRRHSDRLMLVDIDDTASARALLDAVRCNRSRLALRAGMLYASRLSPVAIPSRPFPTRIKPGSAVLISCAAVTIAVAVARHLVVAYRVGRVLFTGLHESDNAKAQLESQLAELNADICQVYSYPRDGDRLSDNNFDISAVIHIDSELDAGTLLQPSSDQVARAVDNLHEFTRQQDLSAFILMAAATAGEASPAGHVFAMLAHHRRLQGLSAVSIGLEPRIPEEDRWSVHRRFAAFDAALIVDQPEVIALGPDCSMQHVHIAQLDLADSAGGIGAEPPFSAARLAGLPHSQQRELLTELICRETGAVTGYSRHDTIAATTVFKDLALTWG